MFLMSEYFALLPDYIVLDLSSLLYIVLLSIACKDWHVYCYVLGEPSHYGANKMKVISKAQADKILVNSLFKPVNGKTLSIGKFDSGKYQWHGSAKHYVGRDVPDIKGVHAVYCVRRQDSDGPYAQLMCVHES